MPHEVGQVVNDTNRVWVLSEFDVPAMEVEEDNHSEVGHQLLGHRGQSLLRKLLHLLEHPLVLDLEFSRLLVPDAHHPVQRFLQRHLHDHFLLLLPLQVPIDVRSQAAQDMESSLDLYHQIELLLGMMQEFPHDFVRSQGIPRVDKGVSHEMELRLYPLHTHELADSDSHLVLDCPRQVQPDSKAHQVKVLLLDHHLSLLDQNLGQEPHSLDHLCEHYIRASELSPPQNGDELV